MAATEGIKVFSLKADKIYVWKIDGAPAVSSGKRQKHLTFCARRATNY